MRSLFCLTLLLAMTAWRCHAADLTPEIELRLQALSQQQAIPLPRLQQAVQTSRYRQSVLDAISRPWEAKPWYQYRSLFLTPGRISNGVRFWRENAATLQQAEQRWQVPAAIIVAIIGIETQYGSQMGAHPVLDALYTLGFHYPQRSEYFSKEFANYVKLADQEGWPLRQANGSYAGAMGMGQFMPSSYLNFAVDGDGDQHKDLFSRPADAIHSVARYFAEHGWHYGAPVAHRAVVQNEALVAHFLRTNLELEEQWQELSRQGVTIATELPPTTAVKLLRLDQQGGSEYWVLESNFYTITRYNRSPLYAMAVYQLSEAITAAYDPN